MSLQYKLLAFRDMHQLVLDGTLIHSWHGEAPPLRTGYEAVHGMTTSWLRLCNLIQSPFQLPMYIPNPIALPIPIPFPLFSPS